MGFRLAGPAARQIDKILAESLRNRGNGAAQRYGELIIAAMQAIGDEPGIIGSVELPRLHGIRAYPIRLSRRHVSPERRVTTPRHLIVYRVGRDGTVEILGPVHDRMMLSRAARRIVRTIDS